MSQLSPGDALGASYRLIERVGSGAAGDVWVAEAITGGARFAAKVLKPEHAGDPSLVERFVRERSVMLELRHANVVDVRDLVVEGSTLAIVMEFVPGGSLRDLIAGGDPLPAADALILCSQTLRALSVAHERRVTHRDIKPDNVLLTKPWQPEHRETVRVADFGIASIISERNRQTTGLLGTPQYMAPELISHGRITPAVDVYSTGVMLYELLAGRTPFAGSGTDFTIAYRHVTSKPPRLDLPDRLRAVLDQLLSKYPRHRPTAAEAAVELARLADAFPSLPPLDPQPLSDAFEEIERPETMLRSDLMPSRESPLEYTSSLSEAEPELGEAGQRTILRPVHRSLPLPMPPTAAADIERRRPPRVTKKSIMLVASGLILIGALGVGLNLIFGGKQAEADEISREAVQAVQQDQPLPTGLTVSRVAGFDPAAREVTVEITYAAQRAQLSGSILEVIPPIEPGGSCPNVSWQGTDGKTHQASSTGLEASCGWELTQVEVPANGQVTASATFSAAVTDAAQLDTWLKTAASETTAALSDPAAISTAYPVQRLQDITVTIPARAVSQTPLEVTLSPVWPSGPDALNPLYRSPSSGSPSRMLTDIAGGIEGVDFADGCSGAVAVAADGVTVTALSVFSDCRLKASVGNFTDLQSNPFNITTRG